MKVNVKNLPEKRKDKDGNLIESNVPLFVDIRFAGTRMYYFTGYRLNVNFSDQKKGSWDFVTGYVRKNNSGIEGKSKEPVQYNIINDRLDDIKSAVKKYLQNTAIATKPEISKLLDEVCKKSVTPEQEVDNADFFAIFRKYHDVCNLSVGRKKRVNSTINHWQRYKEARGLEITFQSITVDLLRDFEYYLRNESTRPKGKEFISYPVGRNTAHTIIAVTRTYWNFARKELKQKGIELPGLFGSEGYQLAAEVYGKPVYITIEERNILFGAKLSDEYLQRVRDIFVFQCLIGARVGDLCKLTKENIQNNAITYIPRKTKDGNPVTVTIPLHPIALEILSRYNLPDGRLLPFITDQRYNVNLKHLFREVRINRIVTRLNPNTGEPEQVKICDIVSSHMARRAFVGNLYGKVDSGIISSMSGHVAGSKAFARYYDVSKELQQDAISKL